MDEELCLKLPCFFFVFWSALWLCGSLCGLSRLLNSSVLKEGNSFFGQESVSVVDEVELFHEHILAEENSNCYAGVSVSVRKTIHLKTVLFENLFVVF